jgi:hypothetical protein
MTKRVDPNRLQVTDKGVLDLTMSAAFDFLNLFENLGPDSMYRLRFMSGFCPETFALCSIFVLRCIEASPDWFHEIGPRLGVIRNVAIFIGSLDVEGSNSRSILSQSLQARFTAAIGILDTIRRRLNATELSATQDASNDMLTFASSSDWNAWHTLGNIADTEVDLSLDLSDFNTWFGSV